eukprot:scaffold10698_cov213-Skeletonema_marinoi.AAC.20
MAGGRQAAANCGGMMSSIEHGGLPKYCLVRSNSAWPDQILFSIFIDIGFAGIKTSTCCLTKQSKSEDSQSLR